MSKNVLPKKESCLSAQSLEDEMLMNTIESEYDENLKNKKNCNLANVKVQQTSSMVVNKNSNITGSLKESCFTLSGAQSLENEILMNDIESKYNKKLKNKRNCCVANGKAHQTSSMVVNSNSNITGSLKESCFSLNGAQSLEDEMLMNDIESEYDKNMKNKNKISLANVEVQTTSSMVVNKNSNITGRSQESCFTLSGAQSLEDEMLMNDIENEYDKNLKNKKNCSLANEKVQQTSSTMVNTNSNITGSLKESCFTLIGAQSLEDEMLMNEIENEYDKNIKNKKDCNLPNAKIQETSSMVVNKNSNITSRSQESCFTLSGAQSLEDEMLMNEIESEYDNNLKSKENCNLANVKVEQTSSTIVNTNSNINGSLKESFITLSGAQSLEDEMLMNDIESEYDKNLKNKKNCNLANVKVQETSSMVVNTNSNITGTSQESCFTLSGAQLEDEILMNDIENEYDKNVKNKKDCNLANVKVQQTSMMVNTNSQKKFLGSP